MNLASYERPGLFSEAVGQEINKKILMSQGRKNNFSSVYLFTGKHGCGKTTFARILAKSINCLERTDEGEPCGKCKACQLIGDGTPDIIELDAASNNSVAQARELIEESRYQPQSLQKKVYIIDEVHMLTREAFNALLKLLEEPPKWCAYILCTTEKHKLPETIISRSSCFSFSAISDSEMGNRIRDIARKYEASVTDDGIGVIVRHAQGSMRDAVRDLEKCLCDSAEITAESASESLGMDTNEQLRSTVSMILNHDVVGILETTDRWFAEGRVINATLADLSAIVTDIILTRFGGKVIGDAGYVEFITSVSREATEEMLFNISSGLADIRRNLSKDCSRALVTAEMLKVVSERGSDTATLLARISELEKKVEELNSCIQRGGQLVCSDRPDLSEPVNGIVTVDNQTEDVERKEEPPHETTADTTIPENKTSKNDFDDFFDDFFGCDEEGFVSADDTEVPFREDAVKLTDKIKEQFQNILANDMKAQSALSRCENYFISPEGVNLVVHDEISRTIVESVLGRYEIFKFCG